MLGDVDLRYLPQIAYVTNAPIDALRAQREPGGPHVRVRLGVIVDNVMQGIVGGASVLGGVDVEADEVQLAADGGHVAGLNLGRVGAFALEGLVDVLAFHERGQEGGILDTSGPAGGFNVLRGLDHGDEHDGVLGESDLGARGGVGANGADRQSVGQDGVVAHLVYLPGRE